MALFSRRSGLVAIAAVTLAGLQPLMGGHALAASGLSGPTGLAPSQADSDASLPSTWQKDPVLSWNSVGGASGYQVELNKVEDWDDQSELVDLGGKHGYGETFTSAFPLPQTLQHGSYWWRVRALSGTKTGAWSADAQIHRGWDAAPKTLGNDQGSANVTSASASVPGIDVARNYGTDITHAPWRFSWNAMPDASTYEIEFSIDRTFPNSGGTQAGKTNDGSVTLDCLTEATSFTPYSTVQDEDIGVDACDFGNFDANETPVFWRVRGIDDSDSPTVSANSETQSVKCFGVQETPSNTFPDSHVSTPSALGTPSSKGQECSLWSPTHEVSWYESSGTPTAPSDTAKTGTVSLSAGCTTTGTDGAGDPTYTCPTMPEFNWAPVNGAVEYTVAIADDRAFTNDEKLYQTPFLSLTPRDSLADYTAGHGYYVGVSACFEYDGGTPTDTSDDREECTGPSVTAFKKATPAATTAGTSTKLSNGERLTWPSLSSSFASAQGTTTGMLAAEAKDYRIDIAKSTDTDFSDPVLSQRVDAVCDTAHLTDCYQPGTHNGSGVVESIVRVATGSYIWRAMPIDSTGNVLSLNKTEGHFTADVTAPVLSITSKNGLSVGSSIDIAASEPVSNVSTSTVHVLPAGQSVAGAIAGHLTLGTTSTRYVFHPSHPLVTGEVYTLALDPSIKDQDGNSAVVGGDGVRTARLADDSSKGWSYSSGWSTHRATNAVGGGYRSASVGHSATLKVAGTELTLFGCKGPKMGTLRVSAGGKTRNLSEHQSYTRCGVELYHQALGDGVHLVQVEVATKTATLDALKMS